MLTFDDRLADDVDCLAAPIQTHRDPVVAHNDGDDIGKRNDIITQNSTIPKKYWSRRQ